MAKVFDASDRIQAKRHQKRLHGWIATMFVAIALSILCALVLEVALLVAGAAVGVVDWHRAWIDVRFTKTTEWLQGVPVLGIVFGGIARLKDRFPANSFARDILVLAVTVYPFVLWAAARVGPALVARYDDETLYANPPQALGMRWAGPLGAHQRAAWAQMREWCLSGAGPGNSAWWRPHAMPQISRRFCVTLLTGANGVGKTHLAEALRDELSGTFQLAACGSRLARWCMLLGRQIRPCIWWRERNHNDIWDVGYLVEDPAASTRLSQFRPRRPTLIIADEHQPAKLRSCIDDLASHRADFRHPVRLLLIEVAVPTELGLTWDWERACWRTAMRDEGWGEIAVVDLSGVHFGVPEFRGLVGAQAEAHSQGSLEMFGKDEEWTCVVDELDHQPILLAEAIRYVREDGVSLERLKSETGLAERMLQRQQQRDTPRGAEDAYGQARPLLRERIISARAEHREAAIRLELGPEPDVRYRALMIATLSNGALTSALQKEMGWEDDQLGAERLSRVFGALASTGWVPPVRPALIADELLRRYFGAPRGTELSPDRQAQMNKALRCSWIINPVGTLSTCARWASSPGRDPFSSALLSPPSFHELAGADALPRSVRVNIVRAYFELAILQEGDVGAALAAMKALTETEISALEGALDGLFSHPSLRGLPALILWLRLLERRWGTVRELPEGQAVTIAISWVQRLERLARQTALFYIDPRPLEDALSSAASAVLPHLARLAGAAAADKMFLNVVAVAMARTGKDYRFGSDLIGRLVSQVYIWVAVSLAQEDQPCSGEPADWMSNVLHRTKPVVPTDGIELQLPAWAHQLPTVPSTVQGDSLAWGRARALQLFAGFFCTQNRPVAASLAVEKVALIARDFPLHEGIQEQCAKAWCLLAWSHANDGIAAATIDAAVKVDLIAHDFPRHESIQENCARAWRYVAWVQKDHDATATLAAAEKVALIARVYPGHERIQEQCAIAWRIVAVAHKDRDAAATVVAAEKVTLIARDFPRHEGIQQVCADVWNDVAWAHKDRDAAATSAAAEKVTLIACDFPRHEGIQGTSICAWRLVSWAYSDHDAAATSAAAEKAALIARTFPSHSYFQQENATAWNNVAASLVDHDAVATAAAAAKVALIARDFPAHAGIQEQCALAWSYVAWAYEESDAEAATGAAEKTTLIARDFPRHERINEYGASAWSAVAGAYKQLDAAAAAAAAEKTVLIARNFPSHEGIQLQCIQAWRHVAVAYRDCDATATTAAAEKAATIAHNFPGHGVIQRECASAWSCVAWAHRNDDATATKAAADKVAIIAQSFPHHDIIQIRSAEAWRSLAIALKDHDVTATAVAVEKVVLIARNHPGDEFLQVVCADVWEVLVRSGVRFENQAAISQGLKALDALVGAASFASRKHVPEQVIRARDAALAVVAEWRARTIGKQRS
ncbi:hypothetical protein KNO81_30340 [Paraburkholderia sediminicola]|nr:hypothetical protein [Paraburkholderia sediminicola]